jgi:4-hydroxy-tetrahydrodipicolinate reductase
MITLFIVGIDGKMGRTVCERAALSDGFSVAGGFDRVESPERNVVSDASAAGTDFDVLIDFSRAETLDAVVTIASKAKKPCVLATTGYTEDDLEKIRTLARSVPVFMSGNMSIGVFVLKKLVEDAARRLWGTCDIEIIEKHHNQKADAPSGTAKMLADAVQAAADGQARILYGRSGADCKRVPGEVTVHSVRGGTIVGEHEVIFAGTDETITLSHQVISRAVLADGSLRAAKFLLDKKPGLYDMKDMVL